MWIFDIFLELEYSNLNQCRTEKLFDYLEKPNLVLSEMPKYSFTISLMNVELPTDTVGEDSL